MIKIEEITGSIDTGTIKCYCHYFNGRPVSYCGKIPRREQSKHNGWGGELGTPNYCPICGFKPCPECKERAYQAEGK